MVKEEIKAFLGNRRISQAVVAQVTGESTHPPSGCPVPCSIGTRAFETCFSEEGEEEEEKIAT